MHYPNYVNQSKSFFSGESFRSLSFQYRIGGRTVSNIVNETCKLLFAVLKQFLKEGGGIYCFYN